MTLQRIPRLVLAPEAWQKMLGYVQVVTDLEINGWAYVQMFPNGRDTTFYVGAADDVFITDQVVEPGRAVALGADNAKAAYKALMDGRDEEMFLQWHSHVKGQAYFSATDTHAMDVHGDGGATYIVSVVLNQFGQVTARLDMYAPIRVSRTIPVLLGQPRIDGIAQQCEADVLRHVTVNVRTPIKGTKNPVRYREQLTPIGDYKNKPDANRCTPLPTLLSSEVND
jgi:hypothetical protein